MLKNTEMTSAAVNQMNKMKVISPLEAYKNKANSKMWKLMSGKLSQKDLFFQLLSLQSKTNSM